ncbi:Rne/Rng family ribonuclease [Candidatus Mycalebacterium sp.]
MKKQILISRTLGEIRIAVIEGGILAELQIERDSSSRISGNIYKAKVLNTIPGIKASFVDIGMEKAGIVSWKDIRSEDGTFDRREQVSPVSEGQDIIVQAVKEPVPGKGPRMKARITIVGKYVILSTDSDKTAVSKKIGHGAERRDVGKTLEKLRPQNMGLIARTASIDKDAALIEAEVKSLQGQWENIVQTSNIKPSPSLLYEEPPTFLSAVRDFASPNDEIIVDDWDILLEINRYVDENFPGESVSIGYHYSDSPLFRDFGIEQEIENLYKRKVQLRSGGDMIIEEAEGLTVIDVNTGAGTSRGGGTLLRTNLEAAAEAARQIRLRNLVGIIVIDFIDMGISDMKKVCKTFEDEMRKDRTSHTISEISEFCVLHLTRKRSRESVAKTLSEQCEVCDGAGLVKSKETVCYEIIREIEQHNLLARGGEIRVRAHKDIINTIKCIESGLFEQFERKGVRIMCEEIDEDIGSFTVKGEWKV